MSDLLEYIKNFCTICTIYLPPDDDTIFFFSALMIGDNCYAGDCTSPELCAAVPVPEGSLQRSQIAYITAPGRTKAEDKTVNSGM